MFDALSGATQPAKRALLLACAVVARTAEHGGAQAAAGTQHLKQMPWLASPAAYLRHRRCGGEPAHECCPMVIRATGLSQEPPARALAATTLKLVSISTEIRTPARSKGLGDPPGWRHSPCYVMLCFFSRIG